jgi:hypothetical protein
VATGSFARGALAELTEEELVRMLELDESLFVEHKRDLGTETHYQLAKAVSSFANTLGGWLLIGVHDGKLVASESVWASSGAPTLVDMVRDRLRGEVDAMPAFEAKALRPAGMEGPVGVVRVYESVDTPHIVVSSGAVFVREVAGDTDVRKRGRRKYEANPMERSALRSRPEADLLSQRMRRLLRLLKPSHELLMPGRSDGEVITADRPHLHDTARRCPTSAQPSPAYSGQGTPRGSTRGSHRCDRETVARRCVSLSNPTKQRTSSS